MFQARRLEMTYKRKALLAAAVAALLTVPGVALASGTFDDGGHSAIVDEVTTIGDSTYTDISGDSIGDLADDSSDDLSDALDEADEVEDSADGVDDDSSDGVDDDSSDGVDDDSSDGVDDDSSDDESADDMAGIDS